MSILSQYFAVVNPLHPVCEYGRMLRMDTILYFQSQSKANAAEKLGGVQDVAAKCGPLMVVPRASTRRLAAHDAVVSEAIDLIRREACSGLTAARVLGRFPCSRRQAEIRFRKATGHSVLDEIHAVQLARAKDLLREGRMPLKAISDFCGFENPNSLRKFFKAQTGRTMTDWRGVNADAGAQPEDGRDHSLV